MSSCEIAPPRRAGVALAAALAACSLLLSACTVAPLYGNQGPGGLAAPGSVAGELAYVSIVAPRTREELEVRNHLIFLLGGGAGEPAAPRYEVTLRVVSQRRSSATVQIATEDQPTAGTVTVTAIYSLRDLQSREIIGRGRRAIVASFDRPRQEFASIRAERDAQDRAARELASLLHMTIAQHLAGHRPVRGAVGTDDLDVVE